MKSFYEMRPDEIMDLRDKSSCAFIPVSPLEWHSYHLPYGTDAIISKGICELVAEKVNGVYFKTLNCGLDGYRNSRELEMWGFKNNDKIFGINFPKLPLISEYCTKKELELSLIKRLKFIKGCGFKLAFVVNHHGGKNQIPLIEKICSRLSNQNFTAESVYSTKFCTIRNNFPEYVGTHAGIWETQLVLAFRPELVDLTKIPKGNLIVNETGIIHNKPIIDEKYNPRNVNIEYANKIKDNIIKNFVNYIRKKYLKNDLF